MIPRPPADAQPSLPVPPQPVPPQPVPPQPVPSWPQPVPSWPQPVLPPPGVPLQAGGPWQPGGPWRADPWRAVPRWSPIRTPAFWILGLVTVLSVLGAGALTLFTMVSAPTAAAVTVPAVTLLGVAWVTALLRLGDPVERRPAWLVAVALLWGGSVAIAVGGGGGVFADAVVAKVVSPTFAAQWGAALSAPYAEELGKAAGVVALLLAARPFLTTVWSGALYGALVGVGFALVEDAGYAMVEADAVLPDDVGGAARVLLLRALVPGVVGHPLFTAAVGAGVAYAWLRRDRPPRRRIAALLGGLCGGALMHATVNSPLAFAGSEALYPLPYASYLAGYILVVGAVALPWLWWLARVRRADARMMLDRATAWAPDAIRPAEVATLAGVRTRLAAVRQVGREHGADAAGRVRRLQRAQVRLAAALARPHHGYPAVGPYGSMPPVQRCRQEALDARTALTTALPAVAPTALPAVEPPPAASEVTGPPPHSPATAEVTSGSDGVGVDGVPARRSSRRTAVAAAVLLGAVAGLAFWPVGVLAFIGALPLAGHRDGGRLARVAVGAAAFGVYCALATVVIDGF